MYCKQLLFRCELQTCPVAYFEPCGDAVDDVDDREVVVAGIDDDGADGKIIVADRSHHEPSARAWYLAMLHGLCVEEAVSPVRPGFFWIVDANNYDPRVKGVCVAINPLILCLGCC